MLFAGLIVVEFLLFYSLKQKEKKKFVNSPEQIKRKKIKNILINLSFTLLLGIDVRIYLKTFTNFTCSTITICSVSSVLILLISQLLHTNKGE